MRKKAFLAAVFLVVSSLTYVSAQSISRAFYKVFAANYGDLNGATLTNVVAKLGSRDTYLVIDGGAWDVDRNVTFPTNLHLVFAADSYFNISNGVSATVNGGVDAGFFTIFRGSGVVTGAPQAEYWNPLWDQSKGGTGVFFASTSSDFMKIVTNTTTIVYATGTTQSFYYATVQDTLTVASNLTVNGGLTLGGVTQSSWPSFDTNVAPIGVIFPYGATNPPSGFLNCDGSYYATNSSYSNLYGVIGTSFGGTGAIFHVPDLRGFFLRGWDNGATRDPDATNTTYRTALNVGGNVGDNIGSMQREAILGHTHKVLGSTGDGGSGYATLKSSTAGSQLLTGDPLKMGGVAYAGGNISTNENRPKNVYVNFIIKY